jgi:AcrR family transcriptional regulator
LDVARDVFMEEGYAAASMSSIAARVGGSKGTLYNYFPSKESLFAAFMQEESQAEAWVAAASTADGSNVHAALAVIGARFLDFMLSDRAQTIHRLVIAESERFPELGGTFYENGPLLGVRVLSDWIQLQVSAGRVRMGDTERMAMVFLELCKSGLHQRRLWNVPPEPTAEDKARNVAEAVRVFMAAYGPL